jgi:hypothetical protein
MSIVCYSVLLIFGVVGHDVVLLLLYHGGVVAVVGVVWLLHCC